MRKTFVFAMLMAATSLVWGQDAQPGPQSGHPHGDHMRPMGGVPSPEQHAKHLSKELGLNAEQTAKVKQIFADQQKKHEAEMQNADNNLSPEERRANFEQARKDVDAQIEAILTDAQKTKFKQMQSKMKQRRHAGHPPEGQPDQQQ